MEQKITCKTIGTKYKFILRLYSVDYQFDLISQSRYRDLFNTNWTRKQKNIRRSFLRFKLNYLFIYFHLYYAKIERIELCH